MKAEDILSRIKEHMVAYCDTHGNYPNTLYVDLGSYMILHENSIDYLVERNDHIVEVYGMKTFPVLYSLSHYYRMNPKSCPVYIDVTYRV